MATKFFIFIPCLLLSSSLFQVIAYPVKIKVQNNATDTIGRRRFDTELGKDYIAKVMTSDIIPFIWKVFDQRTDADRKRVPVVGVVAKRLTSGALGETGQNNIYISDVGIRDFPPGNGIKVAFRSLMYHEGTHIFQWNGEGTAPGGLTEGIADYVMVKSNLYDPNTYTKPGEGNKWDEGYGVTERFLEYCDSLKPGFTPTLNKKMRKVFKEDYFKELLGKPLDQLWKDYKAKHGHKF